MNIKFIKLGFVKALIDLLFMIVNSLN